MKIGGKTPAAPVEELLVLPRGSDNIVFRAKALPDMDEFEKLCPVPQPPGKLTKNGYEREENDPTYRSLLAQWHERKMAYMVINSLEPSQIEWDTVDLSSPKTWINWQKDLRGCGITNTEINYVVGLVLSANQLDENKLIQARESFLLGQAAALVNTSGPLTEQANTPSGTPAGTSE